MVTLPEEFIRTTRELMGEERFARYLAAFNEEPPVSIRINPLKVKGGRGMAKGEYHSPLTTHQVPWC